MQELAISNGLIGNPTALQARWDEDGYWFFRGVLDLSAVARLREKGLAYLRAAGLTDPDGPLANYNGGDLTKLDLAAFEADRPWRGFVAEPGVSRFFRDLTGESPEWIPVGECRMSAPSSDLARPIFDFIHSDGYFNPGMHFRTCWIPLVDMDEAMGGLALVAGRHGSPILPPATDGLPTISPDQVAPERWRRANYRPGDVVIFDTVIAHTGLVNRSNRFRMSVDVRLSTDNARLPAVGTVREISERGLRIDTSSGPLQLEITEGTLCRDEKGVKIPSSEIKTQFEVGASIVVASEGGRAIMVRAPK